MTTPRNQRPLWTCPKCDRQFANPKQPHSCTGHTVEDFLRDKEPRLVELFEKFVALVRECGPIKLAPAKTRIGFQVRMIFAAVNKLSPKGIDAHIVLIRRLEHPRFHRIEELTPTCFVNHFKIKDESELDDEVRGWLKEAYSVGCQEHLNQDKCSTTDEHRFMRMNTDKQKNSFVLICVHLWFSLSCLSFAWSQLSFSWEADSATAH